jgi:hypothetical protein
MSGIVSVQYLGFEVKALGREYSFLVRQASETQEFTLAIVNEAFSSHLIRYQDAPNFCSVKLHRELATYANHPPQTQYRISEGELNEYKQRNLGPGHQDAVRDSESDAFHRVSDTP